MPCQKAMTGCRRGCLHRAMVRDYQAAREAAELRRESATGAYPTETAEHPPILTFRDWLVSLAGAGRVAA